MSRLLRAQTLGVLCVFAGVIACIPAIKKTAKASGEAGSEPKAAAPAPVSDQVAKSQISDLGLVLTKDGIEFADADCAGAFISQVNDIVTGEARRRISYTIKSTCSSSGDKYVWAYTDIQYNVLGQMIGYKLKMISSKLDKEYDIVCSNILRDNSWEVIMYDVLIGENKYQFKR